VAKGLAVPHELRFARQDGEQKNPTEMKTIRKALWLLRKGHIRPLLRRLRRWMWHEGVAFGLAYDVQVPVTARIPRTPVEVRPIRREEWTVFTALPPSGNPGADPLIRASARNLLESGLTTCYVGVTEDGPVYMQFLVTADQNKLLAEVYGGLFPPLADDEGLLEFAYTLQQHRTRPVMPNVLVRLIEIAREQGLQRVVMYVHANSPSLIRFYLRFGFVPFAARVEKWRFLRRRLEFRPLAPDAIGGLAKPGDNDALAESLSRFAAS
jgi:ribosomal protein S18 acetylase RimI-like enzyme